MPQTAYVVLAAAPDIVVVPMSLNLNTPLGCNPPSLITVEQTVSKVSAAPAPYSRSNQF